jgi:hypothetical protein
VINRQLSPGSYTVEWNATNDAGVGVAAGIYFYRLKAPSTSSGRDHVQTRKMVLLDGAAGRQSGNAVRPGISSGALAKSTNLQVTIRATSNVIEPFEEKNVTITSQSYHFDITAKRLLCFLNREKIVVSEPGANGKVYVSSLTGAVTYPVTTAEKVTVTNLRTREENSAQVKNDGGF